MANFRKRTLKTVWVILSPIVAILIVVAFFILNYFMDIIPREKFFESFSAIAAVSLIGFLIGYFILKNMLNITTATKELQQGFEKLWRMRGMALPDSRLKSYEEDANKIQVISPNLKNDVELFRDSVLKNIKGGKAYQYIIPNEDEPKLNMKLLFNSLESGQEKQVQCVIVNFSIVTEYVTYHYQRKKGYPDIIGFMQIQTDDKENRINLKLDRKNETMKIVAMFDKVFRKVDKQGTTTLTEIGFEGYLLKSGEIVKNVQTTKLPD